LAHWPLHCGLLPSQSSVHGGASQATSHDCPGGHSHVEPAQPLLWSFPHPANVKPSKSAIAPSAALDFVVFACDVRCGAMALS
jgi:hypothetical protein